jgi:Zn-finger nucleic acid-binding protein
MIFHEQPTDSWTPYDFKLLEAYQMLQDEMCPKCGHPVWLCRSTSNRVEFKVRDATCYAERALREKEDQNKPRNQRETDKSVKAGWGRFYYTQPFVPENVEGELPTRAEFYEEFSRSTVE